MNYLPRFIGVLLLFALWSGAAQGQGQSMSIGNVEVRIGMPQAELMKVLERNYKSSRIGNDESYALTKRNDVDGLWAFMGSVVFKEGRLTYASRAWPTSSDTGWEVVDILNTILTQMKDRGEFVASITTKTVKKPGESYQLIHITFSYRQVTLLASEASEAEGGKMTSIAEAICITRQCQ